MPEGSSIAGLDIETGLGFGGGSWFMVGLGLGLGLPQQASASGLDRSLAENARHMHWPLVEEAFRIISLSCSQALETTC